MSDKSTHPVRRVWAEGKAAIAGWLSIPNSVSAEALAQLDWDTVVIDMQHGLFDFGDVVHILQAMQGTATMVRVPWNEPGLVMKVLDAGAVGVICPMISTRAECEQFVGACRYPPTGYRSFGPLRASGYYRAMAEYIETAQEQTLVFAMIETVEGMANIDAIASVPGLDGIYLGPSNKYLADYAAEAAWREDTRRLSTGKKLRHILGVTLRVGLSEWWRGYTHGHHRDVELLVEGEQTAKTRGRKKGWKPKPPR